MSSDRFPTEQITLLGQYYILAKTMLFEISNVENPDLVQRKLFCNIRTIVLKLKNKNTVFNANYTI